ncbi:hypothetical protein MSG28_004109 [Choristoneura fumiferana]|uniref:Uncharacterized protein n=1 Tax=Choristoneura fumiferana TaxID=7141 RepID=A0ACC0KHC5_CHOFU|nr:hypothetical protein MSG28_004109 [Choristoneura fumiferana]
MNVYHMSRWCNQEERPTLVLPWLLLAAIRKLLCELLSLALGLATCLLVGPARPPCIKFVVIKIISIMPAFYMWMLVLSYYHALKVAAAFKTFRAAVPSNDLDYGLELAIRRRRTKSLFGEALVRSHLMSNLYSDKQINIAGNIAISKENNNFSPNDLGSTDTKKSVKLDIENKENTFYENQTAVDLNETTEKNGPNQIFEAASMLSVSESQVKNLNCPSLTDEATDTPPIKSIVIESPKRSIGGSKHNKPKAPGIGNVDMEISAPCISGVYNNISNQRILKNMFCWDWVACYYCICFKINSINSWWAELAWRLERFDLSGVKDPHHTAVIYVHPENGEIVYGPESDIGFFLSRKNAQFPREQRAITEYHAGGAAGKG